MLARLFPVWLVAAVCRGKCRKPAAEINLDEAVVGISLLRGGMINQYQM